MFAVCPLADWLMGCDVFSPRWWCIMYMVTGEMTALEGYIMIVRELLASYGAVTAKAFSQGYFEIIREFLQTFCFEGTVRTILKKLFLQ